VSLARRSVRLTRPRVAAASAPAHGPHVEGCRLRERLGAALERGAYASGTAGQAITFASYGAAAVVLAVRLAGRFLKPEE
jgi:hypothetical protein